ncbi:unnamed protein product [Amoebophrya sp. A120]|nr:unnamed protein product [Amoebophrya sp. A120]|eukprot:GSA120T00009430001.1
MLEGMFGKGTGGNTLTVDGILSFCGDGMGQLTQDTLRGCANTNGFRLADDGAGLFDLLQKALDTTPGDDSIQRGSTEAYSLEALQQFSDQLSTNDAETGPGDILTDVTTESATGAERVVDPDKMEDIANTLGDGESPITQNEWVLAGHGSPADFKKLAEGGSDPNLIEGRAELTGHEIFTVNGEDHTLQKEEVSYDLDGEDGSSTPDEQALEKLMTTEDGRPKKHLTLTELLAMCEGQLDSGALTADGFKDCAADPDNGGGTQLTDDRLWHVIAGQFDTDGDGRVTSADGRAEGSTTTVSIADIKNSALQYDDLHDESISRSGSKHVDADKLRDIADRLAPGGESGSGSSGGEGGGAESGEGEAVGGSTITKSQWVHTLGRKGSDFDLLAQQGQHGSGDDDRVIDPGDYATSAAAADGGDTTTPVDNVVRNNGNLQEIDSQVANAKFPGSDGDEDLGSGGKLLLQQMFLDDGEAGAGSKKLTVAGIVSVCELTAGDPITAAVLSDCAESKGINLSDADRDKLFQLLSHALDSTPKEDGGSTSIESAADENTAAYDLTSLQHFASSEHDNSINVLDAVVKNDGSGRENVVDPGQVSKLAGSVGDGKFPITENEWRFAGGGSHEDFVTLSGGEDGEITESDVPVAGTAGAGSEIVSSGGKLREISTGDVDFDKADLDSDDKLMLQQFVGEDGKVDWSLITGWCRDQLPLTDASLKRCAENISFHLSDDSQLFKVLSAAFDTTPGDTEINTTPVDYDVMAHVDADGDKVVEPGEVDKVAKALGDGHFPITRQEWVDAGHGNPADFDLIARQGGGNDDEITASDIPADPGAAAGADAGDASAASSGASVLVVNHGKLQEVDGEDVLTGEGPHERSEVSHGPSAVRVLADAAEKHKEPLLAGGVLLGGVVGGRAVAKKVQRQRQEHEEALQRQKRRKQRIAAATTTEDRQKPNYHDRSGEDAELLATSSGAELDIQNHGGHRGSSFLQTGDLPSAGKKRRSEDEEALGGQRANRTDVLQVRDENGGHPKKLSPRSAVTKERTADDDDDTRKDSPRGRYNLRGTAKQAGKWSSSVSSTTRIEDVDEDQVGLSNKGDDVIPSDTIHRKKRLRGTATGAKMEWMKEEVPNERSAPGAALKRTVDGFVNAGKEVAARLRHSISNIIRSSLSNFPAEKFFRAGNFSFIVPTSIFLSLVLIFLFFSLMLVLKNPHRAHGAKPSS